MKLQHFALAFSTLSFMACGAVDPEPEQLVPEGITVEAQSETPTRPCNSDLNCAGGCQCTAGYCGPDGFGPPTPQDVCNESPKRACSSQADCVYGCSCSGGFCKDPGFSPPINCSASPPDAFESDNTHQTASSYMGTPQLKHTFSKVGDVDWVLVATPVNQVMTVDAYNLRASQMGNSPKIRIEIYNYNYATRTLGTLIGSTQSLICNYLTTSCYVYRATANVTAGSVYAVKVIDRRTGTLNDYDLAGPGYDLKMY